MKHRSKGPQKGPISKPPGGPVCVSPAPAYLIVAGDEEIARRLNPILRSWIQCYGRFFPTELRARLFSYPQ
jgi:hypothetical protein